jgi:hypothetical protein
MAGQNKAHSGNSSVNDEWESKAKQKYARTYIHVVYQQPKRANRLALTRGLPFGSC